jgi:hypothetical protein
VKLVGPLVCRVAREPRGLDLLGLQRVVDDDHVGAAAGQHPADRVRAKGISRRKRPASNFLKMTETRPQSAVALVENRFGQFFRRRWLRSLSGDDESVSAEA